MADNTQNISRTIKGVTTDLHPMNMDETSYSHAVNAVMENFDGNGLPVLQNEPSLLLASVFPTGYKVAGFINIVEQSRIIWFLTNNAGGSEIGESRNFQNCRDYASDGLISGGCDDCAGIKLSEDTPLEKVKQKACSPYTTIKNQACFNFSSKFPVNSVEYRILPCSVQIFFTDNNNQRRWLEFEYQDDDVSKALVIKKDFFVITGFEDAPCEVPIYSTAIDCNKMNLQPNLPTPCIEFIDLVPGGSNKAGVYQFFISYADLKGNKLSSYLSSTNPIPIRTKDITFHTDYETDKAIALKIDNIDRFGAYQYYNLAVAKTINNFTSFYFVGTFPVTQTRLTYTGNNDTEIKLTEGDIFQRVPFYKTASSVTASNNILYWAGLKEFSKPNYQRIANNIKLGWQTIAIPESEYRKPRNLQRFRSLMRDEVYPIGIMFIVDNTEESAIAHIPSREATETDLEEIENSDVFNDESCLNEEFEPCEDQVEIDADDLNPNNPEPDDNGHDITVDNTQQAGSCSYTPVSIAATSITGAPPDITTDAVVNITSVAPFNLTAVIQNGSIPTYQWKQLTGPKAVTLLELPFDTTYEELQIVVSNFIAGTYTFEVYGEDGAGSSNSAIVTVNVTVPVNQAPVADPGSDKVVELPNNSFLNGGNSFDSDGFIDTYLWTQDSGPNTATITSPNNPYTAISGLVVGTYVFRLRVTDNTGCFSEATTIVYVDPDPSTTIPDCATHQFPINGEVVGYNTVVLDWSDVPGATSYDLYIGTGLVPTFVLNQNVTDSSVVLTGLNPNTIYNWYVTPKNANGAPTGCEDFYKTFITVCEQPVSTTNNVRWKVYNTASITGGDLQPYDECDETCYQFGEFAYWESIRRYPNIPEIWGSLCGKPIRHPKMPDSFITHIHDRENESPDYFKNNIIYPLGIKVDHDSVRAAIATAVSEGAITQQEADRITGYRIVRGNRFRNKSIQAKGLFYDVNQYRRKNSSNYIDTKPIYYSMFPFNDLEPNPYITDNLENYEKHNTPKGQDLPFTPSNRFTFHSPDTHFSEPSAGVEVKLETVEYGQAEGFFNKSRKQARQRFLSNTSYSIALTGGIVAALLKTEEKEVTEYSAKGTIVSGMGLASGVFGPFLPYSTGPGATFLTNAAVDSALNPLNSPMYVTAHEAIFHAVKGQYSDWINPIYLAKKKPLLLPFWPFMVANSIANFLTIVIQEANIILDLIESMTPYRDWTVQYQAVGKYNSYTTVPNAGFKRRKLLNYAYLKSENSLVTERSEFNINEYNSLKINNYKRESSLYLKYLGLAFRNPDFFAPVTDNSTITLEDVNCELNTPKYTDVVSYYGSVKNFVPDQYGDIYDIEYVNTDSCIFPIDTSNDLCRGVYGGDTFINRFALKRKVRLFTADTFGLPDGTDFDFTLYSNIAYARHYYNSTLGVGSEIDDIGDILGLLTPDGMASFLGRPKSIRDCSTNKFFYQNGYIYTYNYGIPYFLVESDVNVDYRHGENLKEGAYYPVQSDLDYWLQEENVSINEDNKYTYNSDYSKQNKETPLIINGPEFEPSRACREEFPNDIIYATDSNWFTYKANDRWRVPLSRGRVISIDGIENEGVLIRTINGTSIFKSVLRTQVDGQTVQTGNAGVFSNPPQDFAETTLGYMGSQHKAIEHTEYGHVWVDAKRGQIFNLESGANGIDEISKNGMKNWFKENLPFRVLRDFPNMTEEDIDNNFGGIGISMAFDKRFNRLLITKKDWRLRDKVVQYDNVNKEFFRMAGGDRIVVSVGDKRYFRDASWTWSYNFFTKSWVSVHTYKPNYFIDFIDYFGSGEESGFWLHNLTNASFQVFYGKLHPFTVEYINKFTGPLSVLNSIEFDTEVRRYSNEFDYTVKSKLPGFNKAVVYNDRYASGLLNLVKTNKGNLSEVGKYPIRNFDGWDIELGHADYKWRFNQFYNTVKDNSEIPIWVYKANNFENDLNPVAFNYKKPDFKLSRLRGQWFKIRLTNDKESNYKVISKFSIQNQTMQQR